MENIKRKSNIEILRIIAMFLILTHHYSVHGGFKFYFGKIYISKIFLDVLASTGKLGVNIFIVITSYYLLDSKPKLKKILLFIFEVTFYSLTIYIFTSFLMNQKISLLNLVKNINPFIYSTYWFATTYIILYIISPLINKLINILDKKSYFYYLIMLTYIFVCIPTFFYKAPEFSNLIWFIYVYFVVGYLKKYDVDFLKNNKKCFFYFLVLIFFIIISVILFNIIGIKLRVFFAHSAYFSSINKIPSFLAAIFVFYAFKNSSIKDNKSINYISSSVFSVYLIHDNPYFSPILWGKICKNSSFIESNYIFFHYLFVCLSIFIACIIIDKVRYYLVEIPISKILSKCILKNIKNIQKIDCTLSQVFKL